MKLFRFAGCLLLTAMVTGCATKLVTDDYAGPVAIVADSAVKLEKDNFLLPDKGNFYYLLQVDGKSAGITNISTTAIVYSGTGGGFEPQHAERKVPAGPMKAKIRGTTYFGAPIGGIFGKTYLVEGVVDFNPRPGGNYVVRGRLGPGNSAVWIETASGKVVTRKVVNRAK